MPRLRPKIRRPPPRRPTNPVVLDLIEKVPPGMTRESVAFRAGYDPKTITSWFSGRNRMPLDAAIDLAQALGYRVTLVKMEDPK